MRAGRRYVRHRRHQHFKRAPAYLNPGGLGSLVGDGKLPNPADEKILKTFYSFPVYASRVRLDYQLIVALHSIATAALLRCSVCECICSSNSLQILRITPIAERFKFSQDQ